MNWSRVKTVLIILFLCTDIFLLATYFTSKYASSVISTEVIESTVEVLKNNGVTVDSSVIPTKVPKVKYAEAENVISDREKFAEMILGKEFSEIEWGYESIRGKLTFYGDSFNFEANPMLDALTDVIPVTDEKMAKEVAVSSLQNLGFNLENAGIFTKEIDNGYSVTVQNHANSLPIFNSQVIVSLSRSGIISTSGIWFNETPSQGTTTGVKSVTSALIDFIPEVTEGTKITKLELGYNIFDKDSYHKSANLIPVWKVTCEDGNVYLLDARTM